VVFIEEGMIEGGSRCGQPAEDGTGGGRQEGRAVLTVPGPGNL
jgi:hypothetical protein